MIPIELLVRVWIVMCALVGLFCCVFNVFPDFPFMCMIGSEFSEKGKEVVRE